MDGIQAKIIYDEHSMPIQPVYKGRFIPNRIVSHLLDSGTIDLNDLAMMDFSDKEREQFAQLIGYSVNGFGSLNYIQDETYETVCNMEEGSMTEQEKHHLMMVHDAWIRIMTNEGSPKALYILGYNWAKVEHLAHDPKYADQFQEIMEGPPDRFIHALASYLEHLPGA